MFLLAGLVCPAQKTAAPAKTRVLVILDCSHSMWDTWQSDSKIKVTQKVLLRVLDSIQKQPDIEVALRVFGHLNKEAFGTRLEVPFEADNHYKLQSKIKTLVPNGGCTAATALNKSVNDFPHGDARNIVLIITDGMDDCDGNICDVAQQVHLSNVVVKTFIVGIGNPNDFQHQLDCAGQFFYLPNEEALDETLHTLFFLSDQKAQATLSVTDSGNNPYETELPVVFYDHQSHAAQYTTIYHYDTEHAPDTFLVDPLSSYDITFFTQPPTSLYDYHFTGGQCNTVHVVAPQGSLRIRQDSKRTAFEIPSYDILVRQHGAKTTLARQPLGAKVDYLAGSYDLEILSTPPLLLSDIQIRQGAATDLCVPLPGRLALNKPKTVTTGNIFVYKDGVLQWVCGLNPGEVSERIVLMPGEYQVILKPQNATTYSAVRSARFNILSAQQTGVNLE